MIETFYNHSYSLSPSVQPSSSRHTARWDGSSPCPPIFLECYFMYLWVISVHTWNSFYAHFPYINMLLGGLWGKEGETKRLISPGPLIRGPTLSGLHPLGFSWVQGEGPWFHLSLLPVLISKVVELTLIAPEDESSSLNQGKQRLRFVKGIQENSHTMCLRVFICQAPLIRKEAHLRCSGKALGLGAGPGSVPSSSVVLGKSFSASRPQLPHC